MKVLILLVVILPFTFLIFYWCHLTNSLGWLSALKHNILTLSHSHTHTHATNLASGARLSKFNQALTSYAYITLFNFGR